METSDLGFNTVFVLTGNRDHARLDRNSLKELAPKNVVEFTGGVEALDAWTFYSPNLAIVDTELEDMDGTRFLRLAKGNDVMRRTPMVMVTLENQKNRVLDAIGAGCDGYVLRPYSMRTFLRHIARAASLERSAEIEKTLVDEARDMTESGDYDGAIEAYQDFFAEENQAQRYYDTGMRYLLEQKYGQAIAAFKKAVTLNDLYAEAYKGLAEAYKGKGRIKERQECLQRAAEVYAMSDRLEECKELFIEILKFDAETPNPFNTLGVKLRKRGDVGGALHAYGQALELTPMDENIYFNMAKALYFLGDRQKALERLRQALSLNADFEEGRELYLKMTGGSWPVPRTGAAPAETARSASLRDD